MVCSYKFARKWLSHEQTKELVLHSHVVPLSTISAICPKVMHGHQHVMQPAINWQQQMLEQLIGKVSFAVIFINYFLWSSICHKMLLTIETESLRKHRLEELTIRDVREAATQTGGPMTGKLLLMMLNGVKINLIVMLVRGGSYWIAGHRGWQGRWWL